jgi:hypothetical protein
MSTNDASNALNFQLQSYLPNQNKGNHFTNSSHFNSFNQGPVLAGLPGKKGYLHQESLEESGDITMSGVNAIKTLDRH